MPNAIDITGQRFGKLVAIKKAASRGGHTYWLCQCDCGNQKEIQTSHLTAGITQTCGCEGTGFLTQQEPRKCLLCGAEFIPNHYTRKYCFTCIPQGLTPADVLRRKKRLIKAKLIEYKGGKCQECGYNKCQGALQFHHRNPLEKEFNLSHININETTFSMDKLYAEVDKCDLLCANCHFEKHYKEE